MEQVESPTRFVPSEYKSMTQHKKRKPGKRSGKHKQSGGSTKSAGRDVNRRTLDYLRVCRSPQALNSVIKSSPDSVVKTICNAALNVQRGDGFNLSNAQKKLFRDHGSQIDKLVSRRASLRAKRKVLSQRGGAFWIPALIGAAATALGSSLFGKKD
jgi:hypothetical protein